MIDFGYVVSNQKFYLNVSFSIQCKLFSLFLSDTGCTENVFLLKTKSRYLVRKDIEAGFLDSVPWKSWITTKINTELVRGK